MPPPPLLSFFKVIPKRLQYNISMGYSQRQFYFKYEWIYYQTVNIYVYIYIYHLFENELDKHLKGYLRL